MPRIAIPLIVLACAHAAAQWAPDPRYEQLVRTAIDEFDRGNFDEAGSLFEQAYALRPSARVLRGLGKVRFEQRQYTRALEAFDQALASGADPLTPPMRSEVMQLRQRALAYIGTVRVRVAPAGALISVDARPVQVGPNGEVRVDVGSHVIEARAGGYQSQQRRVDVVAGAPLDLPIALQRGSDDGELTLYLAGGGAVLAIGLAIAAIAWFGDRDNAFGQCVAAVERGVDCVDASQIATEHDIATAGLITSLVVTAGAGALFTYLLVDRLGLAGGARVACAPGPGGAFCSGGFSW